MKESNSNWINKLEKHDQLFKMRFKLLNSEAYPLNIRTWEKVDKVSLKEFLLGEENRMPLFVQTMFGTFPKNIRLTHGQYFAVLIKFLSGNVIALAIYQKDALRDKRIHWIAN
ncbi:hypothetical protein [uncultured Draconibacterium sp.]|uniref:hypothetical protein n=1 Tax=uncultured Draconibacterium sp. TaxID=1573823 RepID=UPI00325FF580